MTAANHEDSKDIGWIDRFKRINAHLDVVGKLLITIGGVLAAAAIALSKLPGWEQLGLLIEHLSASLAARASAYYVLVLLAGFACVWTWTGRRIATEVISLYEKNRQVLVLKGICCAVIPVPVVALLLAIAPPAAVDSSVGILFPQIAEMGGAYIRSYASNGDVNYSLHRETSTAGPKGYASITFKNYGSTSEEYSGWVIFMLRGADLSDYQELRFLIRGEYGDETIGVKARDARGVEISLPLSDDYLRDRRVTARWQEAVIPFSDLGNVDFALMDNFSFYTNGVMAGTRPQKIYVGGFQLR